MSGVIRSSEAAADHPATVTIKTSDQTAARPSNHMLAEHDLQQATRFHGACGHIPSSRCSISMPPAALSAHKGKLLLSLRTFLSSHRRVTLLSARHQHSHGGDGRDRTDDLMLAKQLLSQLSYVP